MQDYPEQIVINEVGAFIPRKLFGHKEQIVSELAQAGVFAAAEAQPARPAIRRVPRLICRVSWNG